MNNYAQRTDGSNETMDSTQKTCKRTEYKNKKITKYETKYEREGGKQNKSTVSRTRGERNQT